MAGDRGRRGEVRRREVVAVLRGVSAACGYAASQLGGLGGDAARGVVLETAAELDEVAAMLRGSVCPGPAERRARARRLAGHGATTREIAAQLGVHPRTVRYYLTGRPRYLRSQRD